jgi:ATP-dependent Lhr-like helicase
LPANRFLLRDGVPVAVHAAGEVKFLAPLGVPEEWTVRNALLRRGAKSGVHSAGVRLP